jgi:glycosyltransferase involved in cell wall biosynthesis
MDFKRLIIIDPGMYKESGHHLAYNEAVQAACVQAGLPAYFLFNALTPPGILAAFQAASPWFDVPFYEDFSKLASEERHAREQLKAGKLAESLRLAQTSGSLPFPSLSRLVTDRQTLLLAHSGTAWLALGLALWFASLPQEQRPCLCLNLFQYEESASFRKLLQSVGAVFNGDPGVRIFAGFGSIARRLAELLKTGVEVFPAPLPLFSADADGPPLEQSASEPLVFGLVGELRPGKNFEIIPPAVLRYLRGGGAGNFVFHIAPTDTGLKDALLLLDNISDRFPGRISLKLAYLRPEEYYATLRSLSALILPYSQAGSYVASGLAQEALALGLPLIFCKGGAIEEEWRLAYKSGGVEAYAGPLPMERPAPENLLAALRDCAVNFSAYSRAARQTAAPYRAFHNRDNLLRELLRSGAHYSISR